MSPHSGNRQLMKCGTANPQLPASKGERGFVLLSVLLLALLYFGMMELMAIETSEAARSASRFRSRIVAQTLAESAAEVGLHKMLYSSSRSATSEGIDGTMTSEQTLNPDGSFEIRASGVSRGAFSMRATVSIYGRATIRDDGSTELSIDRTLHSQ
ncbi:MAG TPA: hypothetical protein VNM92_09375 [Thermoanaerobaculia bacterium]|nr:hypothetical protein [Thermoanaerobaculia bacterium]